MTLWRNASSLRESPEATLEMGGGRGRKAGGMILPPTK